MSNLAWKSALLIVSVSAGLVLGVEPLSGEAEQSATGAKKASTDYFDDPLPEGALHRFSNARSRPGGECVNAAISPDGRFAVVGDDLGRLEVWDTATGEPVYYLRLDDADLSLLAYSPDGKALVIGRSENKVVFLDTTSWREVRRLELPAQARDAVKFTSDNNVLLTLDKRDGIRLWDLASGKELWHQPGRDATALAVQKEVIARMMAAQGVRANRPSGVVALSPDGKILVTSSWDYTLTFRDAATGKSRGTLQVDPREAALGHFAYSPDGRILASSHDDGTVRFRDPANGREKKSVDIFDGAVGKIAFSPDGNWLLSAGDDHTLRLHEVLTGEQILERSGHNLAIFQVLFGPDGKTALTASWDLAAVHWSLRPAEVPAAKGNPDALWEDLRSEKATSAYRAQWALLDDPIMAVELLRRKQPPAKGDVERAMMLKLIADLDAREFRTRQEATKALATLQWATEPFLREALTKVASAEQERRIEGLLSQLKDLSLTPDDWRVLRAVQVLELAGSPETRQLLREWSNGTRGMLLTERAREALERSEQRPVSQSSR